MMRFSFSAPESLSGHPKASGGAPKDKVWFFGGTAKARAGPKDGRGAKTWKAGECRKQKTAVPPGAAGPSGRQAKQCPRAKGQIGKRKSASERFRMESS